MSRLPLPFQILLWFFLNLAFLLAGFLLLFSTEYRFDLDWVFSSHAQGRVNAMRDLIVDDLDGAAPEEWDEVVERFANAYHVRLALFDERGAFLLGSVDALPSEVRSRMHPVRPVSRLQASSPGLTALQNTESAASTKALIRTANPTRYWLLVGARVDNSRAGGPMRVFFVAESASAAMGGLVIDPTPWLRLGAAAVVFSVLFWLPLLRGITRTIGQVTHAARLIAQGRLDARVTTRRRDELGVLAEAVNGMAVRLDGLLHGQKRFLGDVAHELCQPLARLQLTLGIIEQRAADEGQAKRARAAMERAEQMARLVDELLVFSRASLAASAVPPQPVDVLAAARAAAAQELPGDAEVRFEIPSGLRVLADPDTLARALANLLRNALRYGGGAAEQLTVRARRERDRVALGVADRGPGVPAADLPRLFDAFYRVDTARTRETGGVGLGLSIVKTGVEALGGTVEARHRARGGLEVTIRLPAAPDAPENVSVAASSASSALSAP